MGSVQSWKHCVISQSSIFWAQDSFQQGAFHLFCWPLQAIRDSISHISCLSFFTEVALRLLYHKLRRPQDLSMRFLHLVVSGWDAFLSVSLSAVVQLSLTVACDQSSCFLEQLSIHEIFRETFVTIWSRASKSTAVCYIWCLALLASCSSACWKLLWIVKEQTLLTDWDAIHETCVVEPSRCNESGGDHRIVLTYVSV